jgi:hypothetical protein
MTDNELKNFAIKHIEKEMSEYELAPIYLDEEKSNHNAKQYIGEVYFKENGNEVSSIFLIIVYKNGIAEFEWS